MGIIIDAKCPVCGWKGDGNNTSGICPKCYGPLIAEKAEVKK